MLRLDSGQNSGEVPGAGVAAVSDAGGSIAHDGFLFDIGPGSEIQQDLSGGQTLKLGFDIADVTVGVVGNRPKRNSDETQSAE